MFIETWKFAWLNGLLWTERSLKLERPQPPSRSAREAWQGSWSWLLRKMLKVLGCTQRFSKDLKCPELLGGFIRETLTQNFVWL